MAFQKNYPENKTHKNKLGRRRRENSNKWLNNNNNSEQPKTMKQINKQAKDPKVQLKSREQKQKGNCFPRDTRWIIPFLVL